MDRDVRRVLVACLLSIAAMLALLWWRLSAPEAAARTYRHPQELPPPVSAAPVVARLRERADVAPRVDVDALWGAARPGEVGSDDGDDALLEKEEPPPKRKFKRNKKWKKRQARASHKEIEEKMQDPDDEPDDGKAHDDPADENAWIEKIESTAALRQLMQAEDRESEAEEEPEDSLLDGDARK